MNRRQSLQLVTLFTLIISAGYSQNSNVTQSPKSFPQTEILKHSLNDNLVEYSFHSNKELLEQNKDRWEYRFKLAYPEIKEINLNSDTQEVTVSFVENHNLESFKSLLKRFNCMDFIVIAD